MIAKPPPLAQLNQFPQRAERLIPFGASRTMPPAAIAHAAVAGIPQAPAPQQMGLRSLAPRMAVAPFKGPAGPMRFK